MDSISSCGPTNVSGNIEYGVVAMSSSKVLNYSLRARSTRKYPSVENKEPRGVSWIRCDEILVELLKIEVLVRPTLHGHYLRVRATVLIWEASGSREAVVNVFVRRGQERVDLFRLGYAFWNDYHYGELGAAAWRKAVPKQFCYALHNSTHQPVWYILGCGY